MIARVKFLGNVRRVVRSQHARCRRALSAGIRQRPGNRIARFIGADADRRATLVTIGVRSLNRRCVEYPAVYRERADPAVLAHNEKPVAEERRRGVTISAWSAVPFLNNVIGTGR